MHHYASIPELAERHSAASLIRLPPGDDIPLTARVRTLVDTPAFRRLAHVSQLGLVRLVYPGAGHTRFEHSLGVYRTALDFLARLAGDQRFASAVTPAEVERFLLAALLHDIGHWPYCHPVEDIRLPGVLHHEHLARQIITTGAVAEAIQQDWGHTPESVADLIEGRANTRGEKIVCSMLSGPIDVDKIDYLARDSRHSGVPYGRNFDQPRLIASLCLDEAGERIAITDKGKTAAELMVFARYVMFSEVYWHHAARSATAMLQRAVRDACGSADFDFEPFYRSTDETFEQCLAPAVADSTSGTLLGSLFGVQRQLYKRLTQYSLIESPAIFEKLARRPFDDLVQCGDRLAKLLTQQLAEPVAADEVLFDAPPMKLEVQMNIDVYYSKQDRYRPLSQVSPVVRTLAQEQFDDYVKRVRVFVHPRLAQACSKLDIDALMQHATIRQ